MGWFDSLKSFGSGLLSKAQAGAGFLKKAGGFANKTMDFLNSNGAKKMSGLVNKYVPGFSNFHDTVNTYGNMGAGGLDAINKKVNRGMGDVKNLTNRFKDAETSLTRDEEPPQQQRGRGRNRGTMERKKPVDKNEYDTGNLFA
jgi:hypothetical protein